MAKWVIDQIIKEGKVHRAWIGVVIQDLSPDIAESLGIKNVKGGGLITDLSPNSPAQKAGLEIGDIITEFNGKKIENVKILPILVAETKIGKEVNLKVLRNGEQKNIPIKLTEMQDDKNIAAESKKNLENDKNIDKESANLSSLGLKIKPINENTIKQYNLPKDSKGVVISSVDADSDAAEKGVSVGNVITSINKTPVNSVAEAISSLKKGEDLGRENVLILIETNQGKRFIALKVKKKLMRYDFYHLTLTPDEQALPRLLQKIMSLEQNAVILTDSQEKTAYLDDFLWSFEDDAWIPHSSLKDGNENIHPFFITNTLENPNNAKILILLGAYEDITLENLGFERILDLFDGNNPEILGKARKRWKSAKENGYEIHYFQQTSKGWEEKSL